MPFWQRPGRSCLSAGLVLVGLLLGLFFSPPLARAPQQPAAKAPLEVLVTRTRAPTGIAVDPDGTVYFTDRKEGRLWQRAPNAKRGGQEARGSGLDFAC
jgi:streptogramin lyase